MIDIIVQRAPGDVDGGEITSPLICTLETAIERGRQEIEKHAKCRRVSLTTLYRAGVRKGDLVQVADEMFGPVYRGIVLGLSHVAEGEKVYSVLHLEVPI